MELQAKVLVLEAITPWPASIRSTRSSQSGLHTDQASLFLMPPLETPEGCQLPTTCLSQDRSGRASKIAGHCKLPTVGRIFVSFMKWSEQAILSFALIPSVSLGITIRSFAW